MIVIKNNLKNYGKDTELWYHSYQGEEYPVVLSTKKGYLVHRPEMEDNKMYLVKFKHADYIDVPDDDMV